MNPSTQNYLLLQYWNKIFRKNGIEYQSFFEDIMVKAYSDYTKIKPYGKEGDGGNDGYRKEKGIYYQVYAPAVPVIKESSAAKKLADDFEKVVNGWDEVSEIKEYHFVYNDKDSGSIRKLESAITKLEKENPHIKFGILTAEKLWEIFLTLDDADKLGLGFHIDTLKAISITKDYLNLVQKELDRENISLAFKIHSQIENTIQELEDDSLEFEYELLKYRCLQKLERVDEAKEGFKYLSKMYYNNPEPNLYLAELYLYGKEYEKNRILLEKSKQQHWLYDLEVLVRKIILREEINIAKLDENTFPKDKKARANFYRLYSNIIEQEGDQQKADSFIEKAIALNPDRFVSYLTKLSLMEKRIYSLHDEDVDFKNSLEKILLEIEKIENESIGFDYINDRSKATLWIKKLYVYKRLGSLKGNEQLLQNTFDLLLNCYFDSHTETMLESILWGIYVPIESLTKLVQHLSNTKTPISDNLNRQLIVQFQNNKTLFTSGRKFYELNNNKKYLSFIEHIEKKEYGEIIKFINDDLPFAIALSDSLTDISILRKLIIDNLPVTKDQIKNKLLLKYYFEENENDKAFETLKTIDLSNLSYAECKIIMPVAQKNEAWETEILLIKELLKYEKDPIIKIDLNLELFAANFKLTDFIEAIRIGEEMLIEHAYKNTLEDSNKESLLAQTIQAHLKRGKPSDALALLTKYGFLSISPEFKITIETDVFLKNNFPKEALRSIIEAVKLEKSLTPSKYASIHYLLILISNQMEFKLDSLESICANSFVKLTNQDRWYFIGDGNAIDATQIRSSNKLYSHFIEKKLLDTIDTSNKYSSKKSIEKIEYIFSIDKYILWQSGRHLQELAHENRLEYIQMIELPPEGDSIDTKYLISFLKDSQKEREHVFKMYLENNFPLAFLAVNEGSLPGAISRISQENNGFIRFSSGNPKEMEAQISVAKRVITEKLPFYIDGTSALFLSEIGILKKINEFIPYFKVPQSVITMLLELASHLEHVSGQKGSMSYAQGRLIYSSEDKENRLFVQKNIYRSIELLESNTNNVISISNANKVDCFSETKVFAELCDACILSQKEKIPILTEDYLYLQVNELETKKKAPKYFSSMALVRSLYELNKLSFEDYLEYFGYLSSYRFRFLSLNSNDLYNAVFGDKKLLKLSPQNINKFNFQLTLSTEYGVPFESSFNVLVTFLIRIVIDDTIGSDVLEKVFAEILTNLPININKKEYGRLLLNVSVEAIKITHKIILSQTVSTKFEKLFELSELFDYKTLR